MNEEYKTRKEIKIEDAIKTLKKQLNACYPILTELDATRAIKLNNHMVDLKKELIKLN